MRPTYGTSGVFFLTNWTIRKWHEIDVLSREWWVITYLIYVSADFLPPGNDGRSRLFGDSCFFLTSFWHYTQIMCNYGNVGRIIDSVEIYFQKIANHRKRHQIIRFCRHFRVEESRQKRILRCDSSLSTYDINFMSFVYRFNLLKKIPEVPLYYWSGGKNPAEVVFRVFKDETSQVKKVSCYLLVTIVDQVQSFIISRFWQK